jgi:hypothetical protein
MAKLIKPVQKQNKGLHIFIKGADKDTLVWLSEECEILPSLLLRILIREEAKRHGFFPGQARYLYPRKH